MFNFSRCILILLFVTICSKARNAPGGGSQGLVEVTNRRELGPMPGSGPHWGSCNGSCGMISKHGDCWCDSACSSYGDCCYDYNLLCTDENPANTCQGFCGQQSPEGCWCDSLCTKYNDCCPDEWYYCSRRELGSEEDEQSTQQKLEEVATRGDVKQFEKNDVTVTSNSPTSNPTDLPSNIPTESPTDSPKSNNPTESPTDLSILGTGIEFDGIIFDISFQQRILDAIQRREHERESIRGQKTEESSKRRQLLYGTCDNQCGMKSTGECWCDQLCETLGDCCYDYPMYCDASPGYGPDPNDYYPTCQGSCNWQAPAGCWCDILCEDYDDCCPDYKICKDTGLWDLARRELGSTKADQSTRGASRQLQEVATRGDAKQFEKNDITATSNFPTSHPTDVPSSIPTESPTDSPKSNTPTESPTDSPIVGTDATYEEITFDVPQERVLDALQRRQHAADFIRGNIEVEYDVERRQHVAELMRELQMEEESSERRQLSWGSCVGNCNGPSDGSCWCDASCITLDDCCDDFEFACPEYLPKDDPAAPAQNSCIDSCYGKSKSGNCWCDSVCESLGDCCDDYISQCIDDVSNLFSCKDSCNSYQGSHPNTCWCDSACTSMGDCCHDYSDHCARRELGEEENTARSARRNLAEENKKGVRKLLKML